MRGSSISEERSLRSGRDWLLLLVGAIVALLFVDLGRLIANARTPLPYQKVGMDIAWLPETVKRWQALINEMAKKYNIDADLLAIVMTLESGGYSQASSNAGAQGLLQITPPTAKDIASKFLKSPQKTYDLKAPRTNIEFGAAYLAYLRKEFGAAKQGPDWDKTVELIATGYNGGPGAANRLEQGKGLTDTQTVVYSRDAFNLWRERHAGKSPTFDRWQERGGSVLIDMAKTEKR